MSQIPGYDFKYKLGQGGMSIVYLASPRIDYKNPRINWREMKIRQVAVKIMKSESDKSKADVLQKRFLNEAKILASLDHPNIVKVYDYGEYDDMYYIVMEYIQGEDIKSIIKSEKIIQPNLAMNFLVQCTEALNYIASQNIIHRDIKPANILVERSTGRVLLTDFGVVKDLDDNSKLTKEGLTLGTPQYMSPEQCFGEKLDARADIYSLGIVLFEMLTGHVPYQASEFIQIANKHAKDPIPTLNGDLSRYQYLIDQMLAKDIKDRLKSAAYLLDLLESFKVKSKPSPPKEEPKRYNPRSKRSEIHSSSHDSKSKSSHSRKSSKRSHLSKKKSIKGRHIFLLIVSILLVLAVVKMCSRKDVFDIETNSANAAKLIEEARVLSGANKLVPPDIPNALNKLLEAYKADPYSKVALSNAMESVLVNAIEKDISEQKFISPDGNNALQKVEILHRYFPNKGNQLKKKVVIEMTNREQDLKKKLQIFYKYLLDPSIYGDSVGSSDDQMSFFISDKELNSIISKIRKDYVQDIKYKVLQDDDYAAAIFALNEITLMYPYSSAEYMSLLELWQNKAAKKNLASLSGEMVKLPAGCFDLEIPDGMSKKTCLSAFSIGRYEITQGVYANFLRSTGKPVGISFVEKKLPVTVVNFNDAQKFVQWLSSKTGRHFQLPTDAQWGYAAHAGALNSSYTWGNHWQDNGANCRDCESLGAGIRAVEVGEFSPNAWGIYDMQGNVWEWTCTSPSSVTSYFINKSTGKYDQGLQDKLSNNCANGKERYRVARGGSWWTSKEDLIISKRLSIPLNTKSHDLGFRVVSINN